MDQIRLRNLLNVAQEKLATTAGLAKKTSSPGASLAWRNALGHSPDTPERLAVAKMLLHQPHVQLDEPTRRFVSSDEGMRLVVEKDSAIRDQGDKVAHGTPARHGYVNHPSDPAEAGGLLALADFVCAT